MQPSRSAVLTLNTRTRRPVHLACALLYGSSGLLPVSSRRLVQTVRCPFPVCMSLAQTLPREVPVVMSPPPSPPQTKKSTRSKICVAGWRTTVSHRSFAPCYVTSACPWPRRSLAERIGFPRPRPRVVVLPVVFFDFPSPSPTGSNRFAVTRLLQWPCHAGRSPVPQGVCRHARLWPVFSPPCHSSDDSYTRRSSRPPSCVKRQLNARNMRFI